MPYAGNDVEQPELLLMVGRQNGLKSLKSLTVSYKAKQVYCIIK